MVPFTKHVLIFAICTLCTVYVGGKFRAGRIELSSVGQPKNGSNIFYAKLRVKSFVCGSIILMKNRKKIHKAHLMNTEFLFNKKI